MARHPIGIAVVVLALLPFSHSLWAQGWSSDSIVNTSVAIQVNDQTPPPGSVAAQDKKGGGGSGGKCGSVGLDLMLPLAILWFVRRRRNII